MINVFNTIILWLAYVAGSLGIIFCLMYFILYLAGKIMKYFGYYKMFLKTMSRISQEGGFKNIKTD